MRDGQGSKERATLMTAIPFDKLVMIFSRIWDELFLETGAGLKNKNPEMISAVEADSVVSFPVPFPELPGKHGPGRAVRRKSGAPQFLISVIYDLTQEEILNYFDVRPPAAAPKTPNDPRTTIEPAMAAAADALLLSDFSKTEREILENLATGLMHLGLEEIRALGTHRSLAKTNDDVRREFRYMNSHLDKIEECVNKGCAFAQSAAEVYEFAEEAFRKSTSNRSVYAFARNALLAEITNTLLRKAFLQCQDSPEMIWDNNVMAELSRRARHTRLRAEYLKRIGEWSANPAGSSREDASALCGQLKSFGDCGLPASCSTIFLPGKPEVVNNVRSKIIDLISQMRSS